MLRSSESRRLCELIKFSPSQTHKLGPFSVVLGYLRTWCQGPSLSLWIAMRGCVLYLPDRGKIGCSQPEVLGYVVVSGVAALVLTSAGMHSN